MAHVCSSGRRTHTIANASRALRVRTALKKLVSLNFLLMGKCLKILRVALNIPKFTLNYLFFLHPLYLVTSCFLTPEDFQILIPAPVILAKMAPPARQRCKKARRLMSAIVRKDSEVQNATKVSFFLTSFIFFLRTFQSLS